MMDLQVFPVKFFQIFYMFKNWYNKMLGGGEASFPHTELTREQGETGNK